MTTEEMCRKNTENHLMRELENIVNGYMYVYDEYNKTFSRDSAFLKDATDAIIGIASVLEVYSRDGKMHPNYAIEKLSMSKMLIESALNYYESLTNIDEDK